MKVFFLKKERKESKKQKNKKDLFDQSRIVTAMGWNTHLPYETAEEPTILLNDIKEGLTSSVLAHDLSPGAVFWAKRLKMFVSFLHFAIFCLISQLCLGLCFLINLIIYA